MEVIIATHTVKPTSPTPLKCKSHKLSSLDQLSPSVYLPLIFFYKNGDSEPHEEMSRRLRQSLSEILTIFYPLAGEIKENSIVDCNDGGVEFVEARVRARLDQFIQNTKADELKQFVPRDSLSHKDDVLLSVKVSFFDCGGVVVGVCLSHKIADASSLVAFMNAWAGTCRGEGSGIIHPSFDLALRFPPRDISSDQGFNLGITKEKIATERLVFNREKVESLRKLLSSDEVKDPSKVEVVSASIMESFIEANKEKSPSPSPSPSSSSWSFVATHAVNLRPRTVPPIADNAFGNCVVLTWVIISSSEEDDRCGSECVARLRAAIRAVDNEYINNNIAKGENDFSQPAGELFRAGYIVVFTSWRRFPMYDVDFGWGKPIWVSTVPMPYTNLVVLMDTPPSQDGIEAWVNMADDFNFLGKN